ncbi:MAG: hypothetical protein KDM63_13395 [Verrucomicrobiae bacterium]|nr:hypothetical protein [Verrucomicrobiae bacterium]
MNHRFDTEPIPSAVRRLVFDFDGVLALSKPHAWEAAEGILAALGENRPIRSREDYRRHWNEAVRGSLVPPGRTGDLREFHRLAMCRRADRMTPHVDLLNLVNRLRCPAAIVTAGYARTVARCLRGRITGFRFVRGREEGPKKDLLHRLLKAGFDDFLYLGDTVRDVRTCAGLGIPVCATAWEHAFNAPDELAAAGPDHLVHNIEELESLLDHLNLLKTPNLILK